MSTPSQPGGSGDQPSYGGQSPYSSGPGAAGDPFAKGSPGQGGPSGYPPPSGYPGGQQGYPSGPGGQQGYPSQQGYGGGQQGYPGGQGGYPGQQGGYPAQQPYPSGPPGHGGYGGPLPEAPVRPQTVVLAFWCWIATTVVSLIGVVITLTSPIWDLAVQAGLRNADTNGVQLDVQSVVTTAKIVVVVVFLIFAAIYLLFAFKMYAGRNWARIVLTIFGALGALSAFTPTSRSVTVNSQVFDVTSGAWASYLTAILAIIGIVLMYLAPSNAFFKQSGLYRSAQKVIRG